MSDHNASHSIHRWEYGSAAGILLIWVLLMMTGLGPGLIAGLAVFSITRFIRNLTQSFCRRRFSTPRNPAAAFLLDKLPLGITTIVVIGLVFLLGFGFVNTIKFVVQTMLDQGPQLIEEAMGNLFSVLAKLPEGLQDSLPDSQAELYEMVRRSMGNSMGQIKHLGGVGFFVFLQLVFALILGISAGLMRYSSDRRPLSTAWTEAMGSYVRSFTLLMGAQVYVSMWNTFCTAVFIFGVLPLVDVVLPFRELLLVFTAVASLIPAAGNIMANSLILMLTIRYGPLVALGSVAYLFVIHKLEYFVNGYFIGRHVRASVPEMLITIILGEVLFGLPGLITGPVTYAFIKAHFQRWGWV